MVPQPVRHLDAEPRKVRNIPESLAGPEGPHPDTGRLGRDYAPAATSSMSAEKPLEQIIARKVRVNREALMGSGRAGDLSVKWGTPGRNEDKKEFFRKDIESPTFLRFMAAVAATSSTNPHERRQRGLQRAAEVTRGLEASAVAQLERWDKGVHPET
jgi:hypothetical protein